MTPGPPGLLHTESGILRLPALPRVAGGQYAYLLPGAAGLNAALDEFAPDLIHAHQPFMLGSSAYRHAIRREVPLVLSFDRSSRHADFRDFRSDAP